MNKNAFTIIELIVTISIIVLMAVLAFPAFSKYQKKAELVQKAEELNGYINEMNVLVKNPEPGVESYEIVYEKSNGHISKIDFKKNSASNPIRSLNYNTDRNPILDVYNNIEKITCSVKDAYCCAIVSGKCAQTIESQSIFGIYDDSIGWQANIDIKNSPFNTSFSVTPM